MPDRHATLRDLVLTLCELEIVENAWFAKSFNDQLLIIDLQPETSMPTDVRDLLAEHDFYGFNEVYDVDNTDQSLVGSVHDINRHQFVDVKSNRSDGRFDSD